MLGIKWYKDLWSFYCPFLVKLAYYSPAAEWWFHSMTKQQMLCTYCILACFCSAFVICWSNSLLLPDPSPRPSSPLCKIFSCMGSSLSCPVYAPGVWSLCTQTAGEFLPLKLLDLFFCIRNRKERVCVLLICLNKWLKYLALVWGWFCCF